MPLARYDKRVFFMAVAAAELVMHEPYVEPHVRHLSQVPPLSPRFILLDSIPEIAQAAEQAEHDAYQTLEASMQTLRDGRFEEVLPEIDALGTGKRVVEVPSNSPERPLRFTGLLEDCRRLIGEAKRAMRPEVFPKAEQTFDQSTGDLFFGGVAIGDMIDRSLTAVAEPEQQKVRVVEAREHGRSRAIGRMIMPAHVEIVPVANEVHAVTVSQCPDYVIDEYVRNPKSNKHAGYVPKIAKWVIRDLAFDRSNLRAFQEQAAISGVFIDNEIINLAYQIMGATEPDSMYSKSEIQDKQVGVEGAFDVLEFVELCDLLASQKTGKNIFMGEEVSANHSKDYSKERQEAQQRYDNVDGQAQELADFVLDLTEKGVDPTVASKLVEEKVKAMLLEEVRKDPSKARDMFDEKTMKGAQEVQRLEAKGNQAEADALWKKIAAEAPTPGFCGSGNSCGLEAVGATSIEGMKAIKLGLDAVTPDELIHDTERPCPSCDEMLVFYDKNGSKACTGCGKTEIKLGKSKKGTPDKENK